MVESAASFNTRGDLEGPRWAEERLDAAKRIWIASEMLAVGLTTVVEIMAVDPAALQWCMRILLFTGKGGVEKTSLAAATGRAISWSERNSWVAMAVEVRGRYQT